MRVTQAIHRLGQILEMCDDDPELDLEVEVEAGFPIVGEAREITIKKVPATYVHDGKFRNTRVRICAKADGAAELDRRIGD